MAPHHHPNDVEHAMLIVEEQKTGSWATPAEILHDEVLRLREELANRRKPAHADSRTFYIARCEDCDMKIPFGDEAERGTWVVQHASATQHTVSYWQEVFPT